MSAPTAQIDFAEELRCLARTAEMSANIMRDPRRTGGWEGSERVANAFDRMALKLNALRLAYAALTGPKP